MAYISVNFGYNQSKLFSTNCQIAPLLDSIHEECYKEMVAKLTEREEFFNKEINGFKKEQASLEKKLEKLEVPKEEPKPVVVQPSPSKKKKAGKKTKKELE